MAFQFTDANFQASALDHSGVTVVDFWAEWCGPCRMIGPVIEELSTEYTGKALIGKVDVDNNPDISMKFNVRSIPTILILKNGEIVDKHVGVVSKHVLKTKIDALLAEGAPAEDTHHHIH
jgi:thioredoxin 1